MQKVIKSNEFVEFKNYLNKIIKKLNDVKNDVNVDVKFKYNLDKYNQIIEGSDSDVLTQYETWYDQLQKVVINNDNTINQSNEAKQQLNELVEFIINSKVNDNIESIMNKEIQNNNLLKQTLNSVVDKMIDKETIIFNKNENELKRQANQRKHEFDEKLQNINQMKYQLDVVTSPILKELYLNDTKIQQDKEIIELIPSFNKLKEWSGKQKCSIIFDSQIDGDGENNVLMNKVIHKKNLYFITFDHQNNVFGGYVDTIINTTNNWINDPNAFTFSLIRNGNMKNIKYDLKNGQQQNAFYLNSNSDLLYVFGGRNDIRVWKIGNPNSYCYPHSYEYNGEQHPFIDNNHPTSFAMKRILIIQMN